MPGMAHKLQVGLQQTCSPKHEVLPQATPSGGDSSWLVPLIGEAVTMGVATIATAARREETSILEAVLCFNPGRYLLEVWLSG